MASSTLLFPELWLPTTTMLGSLRLSDWSIESRTCLISMSFLVSCIRFESSASSATTFVWLVAVTAASAATAAGGAGGGTPPPPPPSLDDEDDCSDPAPASASSPPTLPSLNHRQLDLSHSGA